MESFKLSSITGPELITEIEASTKGAALNEMVDFIGGSPKIQDVEAFREAILKREELTSTGIGLSIAVPHAKIASVSDYVLAIGRHTEGIEFDSMDNQPVRMIFMVGASARQAAEFVRLLAAIVNMVKKGDFRVRMLEAETPEAMYDLIRESEE